MAGLKLSGMLKGRGAPASVPDPRLVFSCLIRERISLSVPCRFMMGGSATLLALVLRVSPC